MEVFILMRNCISFCIVKVICVFTQNNIAIWAQYKCDYVNAPDISVLGNWLVGMGSVVMSDEVYNNSISVEFLRQSEAN